MPILNTLAVRHLLNCENNADLSSMSARFTSVLALPFKR